MLLEKTNEQTDLTLLFVTIDDFLKTLTPKVKKKYFPIQKKRGRQSLLSISELVTLSLFRYYVGIADVKYFHKYLLSHYTEWFPKRIPNYQNFNAQINKITPLIIVLLQWIMQLNLKKSDTVHFIDASPVKVCGNKRIFNHKVCKGLVVADAGYVSKNLMEKLYEQGIVFITDVKKSMKRLMSTAEHQTLKLRQTVEIMFSSIKYRYKAESSLARSPLGFFSRFFLAVLAFAVKQFVSNF